MNNDQHNDYDIWDFIIFAWNSKLKIVIITSFFILISIFYIFLTPQKFTSSSILSPIEDSSFSIGGQYAGLAGLAGIDLGTASANKTDLAIEVLKSRDFFRNFIATRELDAKLFAVKKWDQDNNEIIYDSKKYDYKNKKWLPNKKLDTHIAHKLWNDDILSINKDVQTGFITISIKHQSPELAYQILSLLLEDIDDTLRSRDIESASKAIEYLENELIKTSSDDLRKLFFGIIRDQTNKKMIAITNPEYIFEIVDPPYKPEIKSEPKSLLILISLTMLGFFISIFYILIEKILINKRKAHNG